MAACTIDRLELSEKQARFIEYSWVAMADGGFMSSNKIHRINMER
jgi:hypothetical protein